ncbi:MAG: hypothetical protein ABR520_04020 [Mycobacteriales bacterium]|nr:hypothetical protein [Frankia sp.]
MPSEGSDFFRPDPLAVPQTVIRPVHGGRAAAPARKQRLGEALVEAGVVTEVQLQTCLAVQRESPVHHRLGEIVVQRGLATESDIAQGLARMMGFDYVEGEDLDVAPEIVRRIPRKMSETLCVIPLAAGSTWVKLAVADPTDNAGMDEVRDVAHVTSVSMAISTPTEIRAALEHAWAKPVSPEAVAAVTPSEPSAVSPVVTRDPGKPPPITAPPDTPAWEYRMVGDYLPRSHPGYTSDVSRLEARLAELGAAGWEAVAAYGEGTQTRILLKRRRVE